MNQGRQDGEVGRFLTSAWATGRDKRASELSGKSTLSPELSSSIPESLKLCWPTTVTGRDAEEDAVVFEQVGGDRNFIVGFRRSIHLREDFLWKGFWDLENGGMSASALDTRLRGLSHCELRSVF